MNKKRASYIAYFLFVGILYPFFVSAQPCGGGNENGGFGCALLVAAGLKPPGDPFNIPRVHAVDPNLIDGPVGYDSLLQWMSIKDRLRYTVYFENDPDFATAPAQIVRIDVPVDSNLNIYSVRLGNFGFGYFNYEVPENTSFYQQRLTNTADSLNVWVDVTAGIDVVNHKIFWLFESIDPATGLPPEDALTGFLPVNDTSVNIYNDTLPKRGEGYVLFSVVPESSLVTGDSVRAQASIIFDINAPLETNIWRNHIDAFAPESQMNSLPGAIPSNTLWLSWSGSDDPGGTGVDYYDLYVSRDGGPYLLHAGNIDTTAYFFTGFPGEEYAFYTRATDLVGNTEPEKTMADEVVVLGGGCAADLNISAPAIPNGTYRSDGQLTASATTIKDQQVVSFRSDNSILLQGNFSVEKGAIFEAVIEACPANLGGSGLLAKRRLERKARKAEAKEGD